MRLAHDDAVRGHERRGRRSCERRRCRPPRRRRTRGGGGTFSFASSRTRTAALPSGDHPVYSSFGLRIRAQRHGRLVERLTWREAASAAVFGGRRRHVLRWRRERTLARCSTAISVTVVSSRAGRRRRPLGGRRRGGAARRRGAAERWVGAGGADAADHGRRRRRRRAAATSASRRQGGDVGRCAASSGKKQAPVHSASQLAVPSADGITEYSRPAVRRIHRRRY